MLTTDLACILIVMLLALTGCGSDSKPVAESDGMAIRDIEETKALADVSKPETSVESEEEAIAAIKKLVASVSRTVNGTEVDFSNSKVSDAGLEHLKRLTNLRTLYLSETAVTDAGLEHLKGLTNLEWLNLTDTQVSHAGDENFKAALPRCAIYREARF